MARGARGRCPGCGRGRIFESWYTVRPCCPACGLDFQAMQDHTWAFMYVTTAMLTGFIIVAMFLLLPGDVRVGQAVVGLVAILLILGTLPCRKGMAMGIEWMVEQAWGQSHPRDKT